MLIKFKDGFEIETNSIVLEKNVVGDNPGIIVFEANDDYDSINQKHKWIKENCVSDVRMFRKRIRIYVFEDTMEAVAFELAFR